MKNNRIISGFIVVAGLFLAAPVTAQTEWLWSAQAPLVNRSTEALATGHTARAVRFAAQARSASRAADRLIAAHNLCLALIGNTDGDVHCRNALQEAARLSYEEDR